MKKTTPKKNENLSQEEANGRLDNRLLQERIAERAYELYQRRGHYHGNDLADWLEAEQSVLSEHNSHTASPTASPAAMAKPASRAKSTRKRSSEQKAS